MSPVAWATGPLSPLGRATGGIFENFQNGHIFLKFLFFLNIKKKKGASSTSQWHRASHWHGLAMLTAQRMAQPS